MKINWSSMREDDERVRPERVSRGNGFRKSNKKQSFKEERRELRMLKAQRGAV